MSLSFSLNHYLKVQAGQIANLEWLLGTVSRRFSQQHFQVARHPPGMAQAKQQTLMFEAPHVKILVISLGFLLVGTGINGVSIISGQKCTLYEVIGQSWPMG